METTPYSTTITITSTLDLDMSGLPALTVDIAQSHVDVWALTSPLAAPLWVLALVVVVFGLAESLPRLVEIWRR